MIVETAIDTATEKMVNENCQARSVANAAVRGSGKLCLPMKLPMSWCQRYRLYEMTEKKTSTRLPSTARHHAEARHDATVSTKKVRPRSVRLLSLQTYCQSGWIRMTYKL